MRFGLSDETIAKLQNAFAQHPAITEVKIYGSRAKGNYKTGSDIDLCITKGEINEAELSQLKIEIDELDLPYGVDLSLFATIANEELREHILRVGEILE